MKGGSKVDSGQGKIGREELLSTRAWEVKESPTDLGYGVVPDWARLPEGWVLGQVAGNHDLTYSPNGDLITGHLNGRVQKFTQR